MLVYGDQSEKADPEDELDRIGEQLARVSIMRGGIERHSSLISALIEAGQLLQGVADADFYEVGEDRRTPAVDALTGYLCAIARAAIRSWDGGFGETGELPTPLLECGWPSEVELRTAEGFAHYAVYPEAYIDAARRLVLSAPPRVIGIRSIGTTLAAVVGTALHASPPVTLRPHGDPSARKIAIAPELERELLAGSAHYVIVDEGPGQSGSSFAAVADWLEGRGVPLGRIAFVPSHSGPLGPCASAAHRTRWGQAQRVAGDFGRELPQLLRQWGNDSLGPIDAPLIEISAGAWRRYAYACEGDWPAVVPAWERRKFLASARGEKLLFKFAGLGAMGERKLGMARALHAAGLTPEPIGLMHGFLVERWCDGQRLQRHEKPIAEIARYIATRARLFPARADSGATTERLFEMTKRNVSLALGDAIAAALEPWTRRLDVLRRRIVRIRTDNRLDRHEWLRLADGQLLKCDALDHHAGHDLIGCQDIVWDVGGAMVEFELDMRDADTLIASTESASGRHVDRELLEFYRTAYLAFRLGQASLAVQLNASEVAESARLRDSARRYATELQRLLLESTCPATRQESLVG